MSTNLRDGIFLVVLAIVEVAVFEVLVRLGITGVERATSLLFILILLNFTLILAIRRPAGR